MRTMIQRPWSLTVILTALLLAAAACDGSGDDPGDTAADTTTGTSGGDNTAAVSPEQATQAVNEVLQSVTRAAASGDIAALDRYYAPDAHIIDRNGFTQGWSTYKASNLQPTMAMLSKTSSSYRTGNATVKVSGDVAWAAFPYEVTADVDGRPTQIFGYGSATLRNEGGQWRIVQTQTSGRPRQSGDPTF